MKIRALIPALGAGLLLLGGMTAPAVATEQADPARGTVKIEETELTDAENPNEVKVGCDFSIEFFGMAAGPVPVRFTLMPPSGEGLFAERLAEVQEAQGQDSSGSLDVDLTEDLRDIPPAQAEDFDYKLKVEAVVKTTSGGAEVTKSAVLFIICEQPATTVGGAGAGGGGAAAGGAGNGGAGNGGGSAQSAGENNFPVGGVEAGLGGTAAAEARVAAPLTGWLAVLGLTLGALLLGSRRLRAQVA